MAEQDPITPDPENPLAWVERLTIVGPFVAVAYDRDRLSEDLVDGFRVVGITTRRPQTAPRIALGDRILLSGNEVWLRYGVALFHLDNVVGHVGPAELEPNQLQETADEARARAHAALDRELASGEQQEPVPADEIV